MNVISLFDGISCGRMALFESGIDVENYYSSEIDMKAVQIANNNWPQDAVNRLGDVSKWKEWDIDWSKIDLVIAGNPCQGFSFAGKKENFNDPRSKLFFILVDIINHVKKLNPKMKFLVENVKMVKASQDIFSKYLGTEPITINSKLVSAQNRVRNYWTNFDVPQPEDRGIKLVDVLDKDLPNCGKASKIVGRRLGADGKRKDSDKNIPYKQYLETRKDDKSFCLTTVYKDCVIPLQEYDGRVLVDFSENDTNLYRKLTQSECEKLQTLPVGYTNGLSKNSFQKVLGNCWTVDVISHILDHIN